MRVGHIPQITPQVLFVMTKYMLSESSSRNPITQDSLIKHLRPLADGLTHEDQAREHINFGKELKIFKLQEEILSINSSFKRKLALGEAGALTQDSFIAALRKNVLNSEIPDLSQMENKSGYDGPDFLLVLAWWLGRSPRAGLTFSGRQSSDKSLINTDVIEPNILRGPDQWGAWMRWAHALGFAVKRGKYLFPDLTNPINDLIREIGPSVMPMVGKDGFLNRLKKEIPVATHGKISKQVHKFLNVEGVPIANHSGPIVYDALQLLESKKLIKLHVNQDDADENASFKVSFGDPKPIARIEVLGA